MILSHSIFFSIELLHEYFLNQKCNDLEIVPTQDCREISKGMNIQWRSINNRLIAFTRDNGDREPYINIPPGKFYRKYYGKSVFRFYLLLKDPVFLNYTNIDLTKSSGKKFYFSNLANNHESGILYLTKPVKEYSFGKTYVPGSLVRDPVSHDVFEAIKKHTLKKKSQLTDHLLWAPKGLMHLSKAVEDLVQGRTYLPGDLVSKPGTEEVYETVRKHTGTRADELDDTRLWLSRGKGVLQYPTSSDMLEYTNGSYIFTVSEPVTKADISILGFNYDVNKPEYNASVGAVESRIFEKPTTQVTIQLSSCKPGKYVIKINKESRTVYYDPSLNAANLFGVIEIFNHLPGTNDYSLLTDDEKIRYTKFHIQFPNRRVLWKYIRKDGKAQSIVDTGDTGYEFQLEGDEFVSTIPIPLSENVIKTLTLEFNTKDFRLHPLPNPQVKRLGKYTRFDFDYLCSDVYLNY